MKYVNRFLPFLFCTLLAQTVCAQTPLRVDTTKPPVFSPEMIMQLRHDLDGIFDDPNFANAQWGAVVQSVETGEYLYRKNDIKLFLPASNMKLFTTSAALYYLGPDFRYSTSMMLNGDIQNGIVRGDIVIR